MDPCLNSRPAPKALTHERNALGQKLSYKRELMLMEHKRIPLVKLLTSWQCMAERPKS